MRPRAKHLQLILAAAAAALAVVIAAIAVGGGGVAGFGHSNPEGAPVAAPTAQTAATRFGLAYLRTLDGSAAAAKLPMTTVAVQQTAAGTVIPASARSGSLVLSSLHVRGRTASLVAKDGRHVYPFAISLAHASAGWVVTGLTPPDVNQVLSTGQPQPKPAPIPVAARRLAQRLADGARLQFGQVQHGVLPVNAGKRILLLRERKGRWTLWLTQR